MSFFLLPNVNISIKESNLRLILDTDEPKPYCNKSLMEYINKAKSSINEYYSDWSNYKKFTNPYEFIHTPYGRKKYISKLKPLSRAYYKFVEIFNKLKLYDMYKYISLNTLHLAEGPGGFIEALVNKRKSMGYNDDTYTGITLLGEDEKSVPGWKKSKAFLDIHSNVKIDYCESGDGDLYKSGNLSTLYKEQSNTMDIITGDGGFDFSVDYNNQENYAMRLIFTQVVYACFMQKPGGTFVIKMFDCFLKGSIDIVYLLNCLYRDVYITKPYTSRQANSEKYIVCVGFKQKLPNTVLKKMFHIIKLMESVDFTKHNINGFLNLPMHKLVINKIENINAILGQQQIQNIYKTIFLINSNLSYEQIEEIKRINIKKCIEWCKINGIEYYDYVNPVSSSYNKRVQYIEPPAGFEHKNVILT